MRTLLLLVTECSVSRTAEILGQTQPTISLALKRLRELLGDPILVRSGGGLVPTERGLELRTSLARLLDDIEAQLAPASSFDPSTTDRRFRIVAANCLGAAFLPRIFTTLLQRAPHATLNVVPMPSSETLKAQLADGTIDLIIGNWPNPPEQLRYAPLLSTRIKCVVRHGHRLTGRATPMSLDDYMAERHLSPSSDMLMQYSPIDGRLLELGLRRNIVASVPEYAIVPHVLTETDLMFTTGAPFAEWIARDPSFALLDAPAELGRMDFYLLWHDCKQQSPAHSWFRSLLREVATSLRSSTSTFGDGIKIAAE